MYNNRHKRIVRVCVTCVLVRHNTSHILHFSDETIPVGATPPTRLTLVRKTELSETGCSVCESEGAVYVGMSGGTVDVVRGGTCDRFTKLKHYGKVNGTVESVEAREGKLYLLICDKFYQRTVVMCDLYDGREITHWKHKDSKLIFRNQLKLALYDDWLYIPDRSSSRIVVYSLDGQKVANLKCKLEEKDCAILTVTLNGNLIITQPDSGLVELKSSSKVRCVCRENGKTVWKTTLKHPSAITTDIATGLVFVGLTSYGDAHSVKVLSPDTGEC